MDRFLRPSRTLRAGLALLGLLVGAHCAARETVIRVALPKAYAPQVQQLAAAPPRCVQTPAACPSGLCAEEEPACLRYRYALGSDYQVLEWLQNGRVDAAAVPALTLELLRRTVGKRFDAEFLVERRLPLNELELRGYRIALHADLSGVPLPDAPRQLEAFFEDLLAGRARDETVLDVPSHLSPALPELFARVRVFASTARRNPEARDPYDALLNALLPRLRIAGDGSARLPLRLRLVEEEGGAPSHVFLVRRLALPEPLNRAESRLPPLEASAAFLDELARARKSSEASALQRFAATNYVHESAGWRSRIRFAFTLDELHGLLRSHAGADAAEDDGIALVLTGGGVKAAYQTKLVDHLYGEGYLRNRFAPGEADAHAVPVKYVVGTSGGALLGIFVASLDNAYPPPDLSTKLWYRHEEGKPVRLLTSTDVFPLVDLMRWLSLVLCMLIFTLVCAAVSMYLRHWRGYAPAAPRDEAGRFWRVSLPWLALLAATPWLLVLVNGRHGAEHIPAVQGVFYFAFLLIAVYADNRIVVRTTPRQGKPAWPPAALGAAGLGLVLLALLSDRIDPAIMPIGRFSLAWPALVACVGVLLVCLALHWGLSRCARWAQPVAREALPAFVFLLGICAASYLLLIAAAHFRLAPLFELTAGFWAVLGAAALLVSAASAWLAFRWRVPWIRRRFDYLLAAHPARCAERLHGIGTARYSRIIFFLILGWAWWNLIVAPGLYGNDNAQRYFQAAARNVFGERAVGGEAPTDLEVAFRAFYAAPVTALEKGVERYVMFQPREAYTGGNALVGYRSWLSIASDPRWLTIDDAAEQRRLVMRVAFASGSPFPVFPAHRIALPGIGEELLVDGGYAHNVPVEASKRLGARRVLVINSSPRAPAAPPEAQQGGFRYVGNLTWMLRWIVPYLYERSQVEDALSAEDLLVALTAPSASPGGWPFLTDFRAEVIERLFAEAEQDRALRIGTIENWGRPVFTRRAAPEP